MNKFVLGLLAPLVLVTIQPALAQETLKVAIGQINNWENQPPTLGQDAGFYKKYNLTLENFGTAGAGETIQAVISGSADLGGGVGVGGVMRAYSKGAPVRILLPSYTGTSDLYWYVKADSPIKSLKDATDKNTVAYSTNGSSSNNIVVAFVDELGLKAKPTATGGLPGTLTSVMSGQIDIGWGAPPFGVKEINEGKIRVIARGSDIPSLRGQTVRVIIANADALAKKKDAMMNFVKGFRESVDWMYAKKITTDEAIIRQSITEYQTKDALQTTEMRDLDDAMKDAVKLKFLDKPLTAEQIKEFIVIPPK